MNMVRASSKFQIAIPKQIRNRLGIRTGQRFMITDKDGMIIRPFLQTQ
ncbi:MAG TPA: AbrB family transcriptional regulator [Armatimonadetes bacterium]|nr:AbrB family transcriptional regulator [Armatimonadota bacterium]